MRMDIERRILELLYFKECVIIPGFGGFVSSYVPAKIDDDSQSFTPPAKKIRFNPDLMEDDGILVNYISTTGLISHSDARAVIDRFHQDILDQLKSTGKYHLESIGQFSYSRTGELTFTENSEMNFLPEAFGLGPFHFAKAESPENPLLRTAVFKHGDKIRTVPLPGTESRLERQKSFRRIAMAIPLLLVVSLLPINSRNGANKKSSASMMPLPSLSIDFGSNGASINGEIDIDVKDKSSTLQAEKVFDRSSYAIVAGSFSTEKNALKLKDELAGKGHHTEIWEASNGFFRVVIQAHESVTGAQQAVEGLKTEIPGIEFWVLK